jgi:hypothetical protein
MTARVKIKINFNGDGQECPSHTSEIKSNFGGISGPFSEPIPASDLLRLLLVKSCGHVYPLSFLP